MNILFFLTPKSDVAYIFEDETLRQTVEKMEHRKFSCIPLLSMDGRYTGTISEGDILWGIRRLNINSTDLKEMENVSIMAIPRRATYKPVHADADMEDLLDRAINQNYVPVVDDQGYFIGIYASDISGFKERLDPSVITKYSSWVARYGKQPEYNRYWSMWQYSSTGTVPGITGRVDLDVSNFDFPTLIKRKHFNNY